MKNYKLIMLMVVTTLLLACETEFLEKKREANQVIPSTLFDFESLINNRVMNIQTSFTLGSIGGDEFSVNTTVWNAIPLTYLYERNAYIWADDIYEGSESEDWNRAYQRILYANIAMGVADVKVEVGEEKLQNRILGQAYFNRAWNFFQLVQQFGSVYDANNDSEQGIPLRVSHDLEVQYTRSSVWQTYDLIISDLKQAAELLWDNSDTPYVPTKAAAYGLLARVYLTMGDYQQALYYSGLSLSNNDELLDLNSYDYTYMHPGSSPFHSMPYGNNNKAILFMATFSPIIAAFSRFEASADILEMFDETDLRYKLFFREYNGHVLYHGSYDGQGHTNFFCGLSTEEQYLVNAECAVRLGDVEGALVTLSKLLLKRYNPQDYVAITERDPDLLLQLILNERVKELYMRGVRWEDLRRLNKEGKYPTTLSKSIDGYDFALIPNSPKWVWPIPDSEILRAKITQNSR